MTPDKVSLHGTDVVASVQELSVRDQEGDHFTLGGALKRHFGVKLRTLDRIADKIENPLRYDYCALITSYEADTDAYGGVLDSDNPDPAEVETAFRAIAARVDALEQQAPASIKSDVSAMADATRQLIDLFEKYDWDVAALMASDDLSTIVTLMDSDAISTADERLEQYSEETCGIDTGS